MISDIEYIFYLTTDCILKNEAVPLFCFCNLLNLYNVTNISCTKEQLNYSTKREAVKNQVVLDFNRSVWVI